MEQTEKDNKNPKGMSKMSSRLKIILTQQTSNEQHNEDVEDPVLEQKESSTPFEQSNTKESESVRSPTFDDILAHAEKVEQDRIDEWQTNILHSKTILLPHDPKNVVRIHNSSSQPKSPTSSLNMNSNDTLVELPKWKLVEHTLNKKPMRNAKELMDALAAINPQKHKEKFFGGIQQFFGCQEYDTQFSDESDVASDLIRSTQFPKIEGTAKTEPVKDKIGLKSAEECKKFFSSTLPKIVALTLELPQLFPLGSSKNDDMSYPIKEISKLVQDENNSVVLSRRQVASLIANAFFCTYMEFQVYKANKVDTSDILSKKGKTKLDHVTNLEKESHESEINEFPKFNFYDHLWRERENGIPPQEAAKIHCIIHYFERIIEDEDNLLAPERKLIFKRRCLSPDEFPDWESSLRYVNPDPAFLTVTSEGAIEDAQGALQADFANRSLGGGVLSGGCVQEEIRFAINTELLVGLLFSAFMKENEAILMKGSEQFSKYEGYAAKLRYGGDFRDNTSKDKNHVINTELVAMDAVPFLNPLDQFEETKVLRELNKAYVSFYVEEEERHVRPIATGNWGCGAFRGDKCLKSLIQLMAAVQSGRPIKYYTFGDKKFEEELSQMYQLLGKHRVTANYTK